MTRASARLTTSFATRTRWAPASKATVAWVMFATVMAQAPASSWRWKSFGAMVVLPCGANTNPCAVAYCAMTARLFSRAASFSNMAGRATSPSTAFAPVTCPAAGVSGAVCVTYLLSTR